MMMYANGTGVEEGADQTAVQVAPSSSATTTTTTTTTSQHSHSHPAEHDSDSAASGVRGGGGGGTQDQHNTLHHPVHPPPPFQELYKTHLAHYFHSAFVEGSFNDLTLTFHGISFQVHRFVVAQSPLLAAYLQDMNHQQQPHHHHVINLNPNPPPSSAATTSADGNTPSLTLINADGFGIVLSHMYSHLAFEHLASPSASPALLKSALYAARYLRLDALAEAITNLIIANLSTSTIPAYASVMTTASRTSPPSPHLPEWAIIPRLDEHILGYLSARVASELGVHWAIKGKPYLKLVDLFAGLDFDLLKRLVESPAFLVPDNMERFAFAKAVIVLRSKSMASLAHQETALLNIGGGDASVLLVRKSKASEQERKLWKASSAIDM